MPVHQVEGGWRWGSKGHVYPSKEGAEKQARAIYANGYTDDSMPPMAAGVVVVDPDGKVLFLQRGEGCDEPGTWCFPGGMGEPGEDEEATA